MSNAWLGFAKRSYTELDGVPRLAMDPMIGEAVRAAPAGAAPDLWPMFGALKPIPTLALRGALSDVLSAFVFGPLFSLLRRYGRKVRPIRNLGRRLLTFATTGVRVPRGLEGRACFVSPHDERVREAKGSKSISMRSPIKWGALKSKGVPATGAISPVGMPETVGR